MTVGPRPAPRYGHTLNILGSRLLVFGGQVDGYYFNDLVTFDLNTLSSPNARWELVQAVTDPPSARTGHVCMSLGDKLVMYIPLMTSLMIVSVEQTDYNGSMILGSLTLDQILGSKQIALDIFHHHEKVMQLLLSGMSCTFSAVEEVMAKCCLIYMLSKLAVRLPFISF